LFLNPIPSKENPRIRKLVEIFQEDAAVVIRMIDAFSDDINLFRQRKKYATSSLHMLKSVTSFEILYHDTVE
jgi:hypothetical protein